MARSREKSPGTVEEPSLGHRPTSSSLPEGVVRREERTGSPAPKRFRMLHDVLECGIHNVCVLACHSIKMHTSSQKELFPPHSVRAMQLAPPQSSAEPPPTQSIVTHHSPTHPSAKLLKPICQSLNAWCDGLHTCLLCFVYLCFSGGGAAVQMQMEDTWARSLSSL